VSAVAVIAVCVVGSVRGYYGSCSWQCHSGNNDFFKVGGSVADAQLFRGLVTANVAWWQHGRFRR
jgi:hypothetical protein